MNRFPDRHNYLRNPDDYGTAELCAYAREILTRGRDREAYSSKLTVTWENDDEKVALHCTDTTKKHPMYQMNVEDKRGPWPQEHIYTIQDDQQQVTLYYVNPVDHSHVKIKQENPLEIIGFVMQYMRRRLDSQPVAEPLNNHHTEQAFRDIMANLAIDSAIDEGLFDLEQFAASHEAGNQALNDADTAAIMTQGITIGDMPFGFTRAEEKLYELVSERLSQASEQETSWQSPPKDSSRAIDYDY